MYSIDLFYIFNIIINQKGDKWVLVEKPEMWKKEKNHDVKLVTADVMQKANNDSQSSVIIKNEGELF